MKTINELSDSTSKHIHVATDDAKLVTAISRLPSVKIQTRETKSVTLTMRGDINPLLALLGRHKVLDVTITETDLETAFMKYYQEEADV
ncbi:MAG TPA: hypothetical protein VLE74_02180 [Candidatus Saccharimonadales bacterium]|nr:hypothetical protein [Candidatus Saccharimonadales bacterium]